MLHQHTASLFKTILKNFMKASYFKTHENNLNDIMFVPSNYKPIEELYLGANCEQIILNTSLLTNDIRNFRVKCLDFYIELARQVKSRFDFSDPVLIFLNNFNLKTAVSGNCPSLVPLAVRFPRLQDNLEKLNYEWRLLSDIADLKDKANNLKFYEFWKVVFEMKDTLDKFMLPNLTNFLKGVFCLPHSPATAERIFSQLNLIKTKNRNKLKTTICEALLHTKSFLDEKKCYEFDPPASLVKAHTKTKENETNTEQVTF